MTEPATRKRKGWSWFWRGLSLAAGLGATIWVAARVGASPRDLVALPASAHLFAFAVMCCEVFGRGLRIRVIAAQLRLPIRITTATMGQLAADGAGAVTPSKVGADPAKLWIWGRDGASLAGRGALIVGEMGWEILVLLTVALGLAVSLPDQRTVPLAVGLYALIIVAVGGFVIWAASRAEPTPPGWWRFLRLSEGRWRDLQRQGKGFVKYSGALTRPSPAIVAGALSTTLLHMAARVSVLLALVAGLAGIPTEGWLDLVLWPFGILYLGSILPPPGGGGALEVAFAAALRDILDPAQLPLLLLWWRFYTFYLPALLGGIVLALVRPNRTRDDGGDDDAVDDGVRPDEEPSLEEVVGL